MLPGDGWRWESLIATCSHAVPRSSLPPSWLPEDPCELSFLASAGGELAIGLSQHFFICMADEPLQKGLQGRGGWEFWHCLLAKQEQRCALKRIRQEI